MSSPWDLLKLQGYKGTKLQWRRDVEESNPGFLVCRACDHLTKKEDMPPSNRTPYCPLCRSKKRREGKTRWRSQV